MNNSPLPPRLPPPPRYWVFVLAVLSIPCCWVWGIVYIYIKYLEHIHP